MAARHSVVFLFLPFLFLAVPASAQLPTPKEFSQSPIASGAATGHNAMDLVLVRLKIHIDEEERLTERFHAYIQRLRDAGFDVSGAEKEYTVLAGNALDIDKAYSLVAAATKSAAPKGKVAADFKEKARQTVRAIQAAIQSQKRLIARIKTIQGSVPVAASSSATGRQE